MWYLKLYKPDNERYEKKDTNTLQYREDQYYHLSDVKLLYW